MNKQQQTALNMARFIKSQSLTLLEKLDALDADEQATMCERLHELAEELQNSIQTHFEAQYGIGVEQPKDAGESGRGLSVSVFASRQARRARQDSDLRKTLARKCSKQTGGEIPLPRPLAHYVRSLGLRRAVEAL